MNKAIEINILGGKEEIGNNKILVSWDKNFLCLDLGVRLSDFDIFERKTMQKMDLKRLVGEGIIPEKLVEIMKNYRELNVVLSHLHIDHYGLLDFSEALTEINSTIRLFMPEDQIRLLNTLIKLRRVENKYSLYVRRDLDEIKAIVDIEEIKPIKVDHSIDAAYAYRIETRYGTIFYTGDYRFTTIDDFGMLIKEASDVDYLITEATRITMHGLLKETSVKDAFKDIMERDIYMGSSFFVFVGWYTNSTRVKSIIEASGGRKVVLDKRIARIISSINKDLIVNNKRVYILSENEKEYDQLKEEGFRPISLDEVNEERGNVVVVLTAFDVLKLWTDKTHKSLKVYPGDVAIISLSEPYDEEGFKRMNKLMTRITKKLHMPVYFVHASGHATLHEIAEFIREAKPLNTYIVHSQAPKIVEAYVRDVTHVHY